MGKQWLLSGGPSSSERLPKSNANSQTLNIPTVLKPHLEYARLASGRADAIPNEPRSNVAHWSSSIHIASRAWPRRGAAEADEISRARVRR